MKYEVIDNKFSTLLTEIRKVFATSKESIWDKRNKLKIVNLAESKEELIIKSFKVPHFINKIAYTFCVILKHRGLIVIAIRL
ncbi:MAG: hypothetical protein Q9M36_15340 [Sulfurovum sp.]|nr:hypothetical protein [Sulfurovum sp.]